MITYCGTLLVSKDLSKTKAFYKNLFGLRVTLDYGAYITLTGGILFQILVRWKDVLHQPEETIKAYDVMYVHPLQSHKWGQRGIRVYEPDNHIIEISERLALEGMSIEDISKKSMITIKMIERYLKK